MEEVELWKRNPVDCVKELMGNPAFREYMSYAPEIVHTDAAQTNRVFDEMWTADWWAEIQVRLYINQMRTLH